MQVTISDKSKAAFEAAAKKLNLNNTLPEINGVRPDLALWLTANYMLAVIIEADKDGKIHDITNHDVRKYETIHYAKNGCLPGSGSGFSFGAYDYALTATVVSARLSFNSSAEAKSNAEQYPELWEIVKLNVK
jgi:hypothetical protein